MIRKKGNGKKKKKQMGAAAAELMSFRLMSLSMCQRISQYVSVREMVRQCAGGDNDQLEENVQIGR